MSAYRFIEAKTILSKMKGAPDPYFGITYNMNLYRGCQHACIYCDTRSDCYRIGDLSDIRVKENALEILQKELRSKRMKGTIGFGSMNDPYMQVEKELELTRKALELIKQHRFPVHLLTKSDMVLRDMDIFKEISKVYAAVSLTITTHDDKLSRIIEPAAPPSSQRFEAIRQLNENGIYAGVIFSPVLPFINDTEENIFNMVQMAQRAKAPYMIFWPGMTIRDGQREFFYDKLDKHFPGLSQKYRQTYGNSYGVSAPNAQFLNDLFYRERKKYGIRGKMNFYEGEKPSQLSLF